MMEALWKDLPSDILERVATFLPLASVIRLTCVSKAWNALIHTREFALRHACAAPPEHYVLVTTRYDEWETPNPVRHWEVLNTARTAFFTIRNDFLTDYVLREGIPTPYSWRTGLNERAVLAADGGLVCMALYSTILRTDFTLLVCNPLLRSVRRLPELEAWFPDEQRVVMATDRQSMEYQVFVVSSNYNPPYSNKVYIYESKTGAWRELSSSSLLDPTQVDRFGTKKYEGSLEWEALSTCVRNKVYKLFLHSDISLSAFVSFEMATGAVSEVRGPDIDAGYQIQLVVVQDRLFYIAVVVEECDLVTEMPDEFLCWEGPWIQVFEVREEKCHLVTEMPDEFLSWVMADMSKYCVHNLTDGPDMLFAVGCGREALLFCSRLGRSVAYNLSGNTWDYYPNNGLGEALKAIEKFEICGSNYFLSLCPP